MTAYTFPFLDWRQSIEREPTDWEMSLASAIEAAFAKKQWELDELVAALNASRVRPRAGGEWTAETFKSAMRELGA